jgi:integrase
MRHQNGFGSIVKLGGKRRKPYAVRLTVGWKDGKQVRKYLGFYKSEREALMALADYHKSGYDIDLSKLTLAETYDRWIKRIETKVSSKVLTTHKMAFVRFGRLADVPIVNIKADQLQDWMDNIDDLSSGSKIQVKSTMSQIWKYAIKNDIVSSNYAEHIDVERVTERKGTIFTAEEIKTLWNNSDNKIVQWYLILIYTGMRIGELLSMTTDNIHLDEQYMVGGSKTKAGINRIIPIHDAILPFIKQQSENSKYLVHNGMGKKYSYSKARSLFNELMAEYKWEHLPHDARKTAVSLLHSAGVPIETIRVIVGHSGKGVTEKVYLYKTPSELVEMVNRVKIDTQPIDTDIEISE